MTTINCSVPEARTTCGFCGQDVTDWIIPCAHTRLVEKLAARVIQLESDVQELKEKLR